MSRGASWRSRRDAFLVKLAARYVLLVVAWKLWRHDPEALRVQRRARRAGKRLPRVAAWVDVTTLDREPLPERVRLLCDAARSAAWWREAEAATRATVAALPTYRERILFVGTMRAQRARMGQELPEPYGWEILRDVDRDEAARDLDALLAGPYRSVVLDHVGALVGVAGVEERRADGRLSEDEANDLMRFLAPE